MPKILYVENFKIGDPYFENLPIDLEILIIDSIHISFGNCIKNLPFSLRRIYVDMYRKQCNDIEFILPFGCKIEFNVEQYKFRIHYNFRMDYIFVVVKGISELYNYNNTDISIKSDTIFSHPEIVDGDINFKLYDDTIRRWSNYKHK